MKYSRNFRGDLLEKYERLLEIQLSPGNWDYDPYQHGMANGMILFHSMAKDPHGANLVPYKDAPEYWKSKFTCFRRKFWYCFLPAAGNYFRMGCASMITNITGLRFGNEN